MSPDDTASALEMNLERLEARLGILATAYVTRVPPIIRAAVKREQERGAALPPGTSRINFRPFRPCDACGADTAAQCLAYFPETFCICGACQIACEEAPPA